MLVLSRKSGEQIQIGDDVTIEVRRVAGNRVALAVQAPRDVRILRGELVEAATSFEEPDAEKAKEDVPKMLTFVIDGSDCRMSAASA